VILCKSGAIVGDLSEHEAVSKLSRLAMGSRSSVKNVNCSGLLQPMESTFRFRIDNGGLSGWAQGDSSTM
jgi:hypothetical protein